MAATYLDEIGPIINEIRALGYDVRDLSGLRRVVHYQSAEPVLLQWLKKVSDDDLKEDLVRTLSMPWTDPENAKAFILIFRKTGNQSLKWAIGNALSIVADDKVAEDIIELVGDKRHGTARQMMVVSLGRLKDPRAPQVAINLLDDPEVQGHAIIALRKLKAVDATPNIIQMLEHPKTWIRNEAKKALVTFEKSIAKRQKIGG